MSLRLIACLFAVTALNASASDAPRPRVVASTTIVGDLVRAVAGDAAEVAVLLKPGQDPHLFEPLPRDASLIGSADAVFLNGAGLETFLAKLLETNQRDPASVVELSHGLPLRSAEEEDEDEHAEHHHDHDHGSVDPHTWLDPQLVLRWVDRIEATLAQLNPVAAEAIAARAEATRAALRALDTDLAARFAAVPVERRRIATDHDAFGYFADRYGLTVTGSLLPSVTTAAELSARDLAALHKHIRETGTRVLVLDASERPTLAEQAAHDAGLHLIRVPIASLTAPEGVAPTYTALMQHLGSELATALQQP